VASRKVKQAMSDYVHHQLDRSGLYALDQEIDHIIATPHNPEILPVYVALHSSRTPLKAQRELVAENKSQRMRTADVFYNNDAFYVRLADVESLRSDKSLKNYSHQELNNMRKMSGLEKQVMDQQGNRLVYYQPQTSSHSEKVRFFDLKPVILDYSHINPDDQPFVHVENRTSVDYKLPLELFPKKAAIAFDEGRKVKAHIIPAEVANPKIELIVEDWPFCVRV